MHFKKVSLIILHLFASSLFIVHAQTFDLGCMTQDDATLGIDRKNWAGGSTSNHSDGTMLNFTLPSNTFGDCKKITEITFEVVINDVDLSGVPVDCVPGQYWLNSYVDVTLPFDPASIPTSQNLDGFGVDDWATLNDSYTFTCDDFDLAFDNEVGMDIIYASGPCSEFQNLVIGGFIIFDYSICVTGVVGDSGDPPNVNAGAVFTEVCIGQDFGLSETGGDATMWEWEGPNGFSTTVQNPLIFGSTMNDIGTYMVTVTDDDGCTNTDEVTITAAPTPDAMAEAIDMEVCPGEDIQLQETGGSAVMWSWSGPDAFTSPNQNPTITGSSNDNLGTYFVIVTDGNGCTNTSEITIASAPMPDALAEAVFTDVCPGEDIQLQENGGDGDMWSWSGPDGFTSTDQNPTITGSTLDNLGLYSVTVTDASGCSNTSEVTINAGTPPNADADANVFAVCIGQDIELFEIGGDAVSWSWTGPTGFTSTDQNPVISSATDDNDGTYTVEVTDSGGCTNTSQLIISFADNPTGCLSGDGQVCEDECNAQMYFFDLTPSSGDFEIELSFPGSGIPNYTLTNIFDGQGIGMCSDPFNGVADFDGINLILPTSTILDGEIIEIEIVSLTNLNNPDCPGVPDSGCVLEIEFLAGVDPVIEFDGNIISDGDPMNCITGFDPVIDITGVAGTWSIDGFDVFLPVDLTSYPPGDHIVSFVPDSDQCVFPVEVTIDVIPCANCVITDAFLDDVDCNSNLTDTDDTDDYITFSLDPQAVFEGVSYTVMVSSGTVMPSTGTYGGPMDFELQDGSAGAGDITITIQDVDDLTCFIEITLIDPGTCSGACNITTAEFGIVSCDNNDTPSDPTDDFIVFELEVDGINIGTGYDVMTPSGTLNGGNYGTTSQFELPVGSAGEGDISITIIDINDPSCFEMLTLLDPGTCSGACSIDAIIPNIIGCDNGGTVNDPTDDIFSFEINPTGSNLTGDYTITSGNAVSPAMGTFGGTSSFTTNSILPSGGDFMVTIASVDDPTCTQTFLITDTGPCSMGCPDPGTCDDGVCGNGLEIWDDTICDCVATDIPDPSTCVDDGDCSNGIETWNDQSCECEVVTTTIGCTNPTANNFDPAATCDDGSCEFDCDDPGDCDNGECSDGEEVWDGTICDCISINIPDPDSCLDDGDCSNGVETWNDTNCECEQLDIPDPDSCVNDGDCTNGIETWNDLTCECDLEMEEMGCTDPNANNFDPNAVCDDGSCEYDCPDPGDCDNGDCTDGEEVWDGSICECISINIPDPDSCIDDGDCTNGVEIWNDITCECEVETEVLGCTDPNANNYDPNAVCDDGTCTYDCPDPGDCDNGICEDGEEVWNDSICECEAINIPTPCVDDGDCNNGEEVWDSTNCECVTENFIDPASCIDDGDCTNGLEFWDDQNCECLTVDPIDCAAGGGILMECDDEDPCTVNDMMTIIECSNEICVPCAGIVLDCADENNVIVEPCDDGSDFTENDTQTILECDGSICIPCEGTLQSPSIFFPQIFTPDGDGNNDEWGLFSNQEFLIKELKVYDRWGEVLFSVSNIMNTDEEHKWNGRFNNTLVNPGVYVYYVELGEPFNNVLAGDLTLVY